MSDIEKHRGDTKPIVFQLWEDRTAGTKLDITGFSFKFTVNQKKAPEAVDAFEFTLVGAIVGDPVDGKVQFLPSAVNMDLVPKTYYYDFEVTDASGYISTELLNKFKITQDITK